MTRRHVRRDARLDDSLGLRGTLPAVNLDPLAGLEVFVVLEEVLDLLFVNSGMSSRSWMCAQRGSFACTQITLASLPPSSVMLNTATGRTEMPTPGNVGASSRMRASTGSPSRPRVFSKNP